MKNTRMKLGSQKEDWYESEIQKLFVQYACLYEFKKNSFVFYEGDFPKAIYLIEKGLLKVCQSTLAGQDVTFFLRKKGDVFGFSEVILERNRERSAQCLDDCLIWVLDSNIFLDKIRTNSSVNRDVLNITHHRLLKQQRMVELLISQPVSWRLAWLLKELSTQDESGKYVIYDKLTHIEISNIIGCSRQTVTEILSIWKARGLIKYNRKGIIIMNLDGIFQ